MAVEVVAKAAWVAKVVVNLVVLGVLVVGWMGDFFFGVFSHAPRRGEVTVPLQASLLMAEQKVSHPKKHCQTRLVALHLFYQGCLLVPPFESLGYTLGGWRTPIPGRSELMCLY